MTGCQGLRKVVTSTSLKTAGATLDRKLDRKIQNN